MFVCVCVENQSIFIVNKCANFSAEKRLINAMKFESIFLYFFKLISAFKKNVYLSLIFADSFWFATQNFWIKTLNNFRIFS